MKGGRDGYEAADGSFTYAEFLRLNPNGFVPTLSVDGTIITEMPAILTYLTSLAPDRELLGTTSMDTIKAAEWMAWLSGTLHGYGFGMLWRPQRFVGSAEDMYDTVRAQGRRTILRCFERIEDRVSGRYAVGVHLTAVDVYLHTFWRWGCAIDIDMHKLYPKYAELARNVEKLDSLRGAMAEEHQALTFPASGGQL